MSISYSISYKQDVNNKEGEKRVNFRSQANRTMKVEEMARYAVAHYGPEMHHTQLLKAIDMMKQTVIDMLKEGNRVSLGDLGTFYYHIDAPSMTESEFQEKGFKPSRDVKDVVVRWRPSQELKSLMQHGKLDFQQRSTLKLREEIMKERMKNPEL